MKGVFLDIDSVQCGQISLAPLINCLGDWTWYDSKTSRESGPNIANANIIISNKISIGEAEIRAAKNLQLICVAATGVNNIDLDAAAAAGIPVCNVRNYATPSVVQNTFMMILSLHGKLFSFRQAVNNGDWSRSPHFSLLTHSFDELAGKTLGIVGYGELGKAVEKVAKAFGLRTIIAESPNSTDNTHRYPLPELLTQSDIVSLHCPLTSETHHLINEQTLSYMKQNAILINTARGAIVDETALLSALKRGEIGGAGLDVLATEPPSIDSPILQADLDNLIVMPHVAWASIQARQRLINQIAENIQHFLRGELINQVN